VNKKLTLVSVVLLSCIGCSSDTNDQQKMLDDNQAKWESLNITDYTFTQRRSCFCDPEVVQPTVLLIKDNQTVLSYTEQDEVIVDEQFRSSFLTVNELFSKVNSLIDNSESLTVEYHPTFGYPTLISADIDKQMADDEFSINSGDFVDTTDAVCPEVFFPSFTLNIIDNDTQAPLNCDVFGSFKFEEKDTETFIADTNNQCDSTTPIDLGADFGIANLTVESDGYSMKEIEKIHIIADHCHIKTQNINISLTAK
jgi:hypothetical protein